MCCRSGGFMYVCLFASLTKSCPSLENGIDDSKWIPWSCLAPPERSGLLFEALCITAGQNCNSWLLNWSQSIVSGLCPKQEADLWRDLPYENYSLRVFHLGSVTPMYPQRGCGWAGQCKTDWDTPELSFCHQFALLICELLSMAPICPDSFNLLLAVFSL